jgi:transglutaminase-like putative cysteine protease
MRIRIVHETRYRYERPVRGIIQHLRLAPRDHHGQHVLAWRIEPDMDGILRAEEDGYGNLVHVFSADGPAESLAIRVAGEVETSDLAGVVSGAVERVPEIFYLRDTALTEASDEIRLFARDRAEDGDGDVLACLHRLLAATHDTLTFDTTPTQTTTSAAQAFRLRRGVCQDLTHVFVSAARHLDIPARYVSGYFHRATASSIRRRPTPGRKPACRAWAGSASIRPTGSARTTPMSGSRSASTTWTRRPCGEADVAAAPRSLTSS